MAKPSTGKKPISLHPLSFKEAVTSLLQVEPSKQSKSERERCDGDRPQHPRD